MNKTHRLLQKLHFPYFSVLMLSLLILFNSASLYWQRTTSTDKIDFFALWAIPQGLSNITTPNIYSLKGQQEFALELSKQASLPKISEKQRHTTGLVIGISGGRINTTASVTSTIKSRIKPL